MPNDVVAQKLANQQLAHENSFYIETPQKCADANKNIKAADLILKQYDNGKGLVHESSKTKVNFTENSKVKFKINLKDTKKDSLQSSGRSGKQNSCNSGHAKSSSNPESIHIQKESKAAKTLAIVKYVLKSIAKIEISFKKETHDFG